MGTRFQLSCSHKHISSSFIMKLFAFLAVAGLCVSAQNLKPMQQKKLTKKANQIKNDAIKNAEAFAKASGIKVDVQSIIDSMTAQYEGQVKAAAKQAQAEGNQQRAQLAQKYQKEIDAARKMNLNKARNMAKGAVSAAVKNSGAPAEIQSVANQLIAKMNQAFNANLKKYKVNGAASMETLAKNQFNKNKQNIQAQIDAAARKAINA